MVTREQFVARLAELYKKHYGVSLSQENADKEFCKLVQLYKLVYLTSQQLPARK